MSDNWEDPKTTDPEFGYEPDAVADSEVHPDETQYLEGGGIPGRDMPEIRSAPTFIPGTSRNIDPRAEQNSDPEKGSDSPKGGGSHPSNPGDQRGKSHGNNGAPNSEPPVGTPSDGGSSEGDGEGKNGGDPKPGGGKGRGGVKGVAGNLAKSAAAQAVPEKAAETAAKAAETARRVQSAVHTVVHSVQGAVAVVTNPVSWIILAAAVIITVVSLAVTSSMMVIGRNENADGCFGIGGDAKSGRGILGIGSAIQGAKDKVDQEGEDWTQRGNQAGSWLMSQKWEFLGGKGMSREQAAGILGNFIQESGLKYARAEMKGPNADGSLDHMSNEQADAFTKDSAPAGLGLAQWTWNPGRAKTLLDLAKSMGKNWYDAEVQLTMIKNEVEASYGQRLLAAGFNDQGKSEKELALIFHDVYEGSADGAQGLKERQDSASEFLSKFTGSAGLPSSDGGGSCSRGGGTAVGGGKDNIVKFAISIAYPTKEESKCPEPRGYSCAPQAYKDAKHKMEGQTGADPLDLWADCGRFAATVVKNTVDPEFPWGPTGEQYRYASSSPKWQAYNDYSQRQPGDIFITKPEYVGHIFVYLGQVDGVEKIAEASMEERVGGVGEFYLNSSLTEDYAVGGAHRQFTGFHYVGG